MEVTPDGLARLFEVVLPHLNELQRRVLVGAAAEMLGRGGKTAVAAASGMSRNTVIEAAAEMVAGVEPSQRLRAPGGGDKSLIDTQPGLLESLDALVHPETRGSPMSLLRWTSKSSTVLAEELVRRGFTVSSRTVLRLLHRLGYSLQVNAKVIEGLQHPDRDGQFRYLNDTAVPLPAPAQRPTPPSAAIARPGSWPATRSTSWKGWATKPSASSGYTPTMNAGHTPTAKSTGDYARS